MLAGAGYASGVSCLTVGLRALAGAGILYVLVIVSGRIVVNMIVDTMMKNAASAARADKASRDRNR